MGEGLIRPSDTISPSNSSGMAFQNQSILEQLGTETGTVAQMFSNRSQRDVCRHSNTMAKI